MSIAGMTPASKLSERHVYLNGTIMPERQASISIFDRGYIWGDAVYDAARTFNGKPFKLWEHVLRLYRSMKYCRIKPGMEKEQFYDEVVKLVAANATLLGPNEDYLIRMHVSRGNIPIEEGSLHWEQEAPPTVVVFCLPINLANYAKYHDAGMPLVIPSTRRMPPQCLSPQAKVSNKMNNFIATYEARDVDKNAQALMLDMNGYVTESQGANFMYIADGRIYMPHRSGALVGESMMTVVELADKLNIDVIEGFFTPYDVYQADEAFLTAGSFCMMPICTIDNHPLNMAAPGPMTKRLLEAWSHLVGIDIVGQMREQARTRNM